MEYVEAASVVIVVLTALWKGIEGIVNHRVQKKVKLAEVKNVSVQAETKMIQNWVQWSQTLEKRVKEAEETINSLKKIIQCQKRKLSSMERQNKSLSKQLQRLKIMRK